MTEEELYNEYRKSDCKSFTDFLINKITELKADNDARKFAMAMSEKVEKQLREENAELKAVERMALYSKLSDQLTKAKEIIKDLLADNADWSNKLEAEQYLKEVK